MTDREENIEWAMAYCQHYTPDAVCKAGVDMTDFRRNFAKIRSISPCINGHKLANPIALCPHWLRVTRAQGEIAADYYEAEMERTSAISAFVAEWRKKPPIGKIEIVPCPACGGRLHLRQSAYNGHVHGDCETAGCASWLE